MTKNIKKTGERVIPEKFQSKEEYFIYLQHLFAYEFAQKMIAPGSIVLDVGSGSGYGTELLSKNALRTIGLDVNGETVEYSKGKYGSEKCIFNQYDGRAIPFEDNTFDAVVSFQVIEHIRNDHNYVMEIRRVLKNDGLFLLITPNRLIRLKNGQKPFNRFHVREYTPYELENVLKKYFSNIEINGVTCRNEIRNVELNRIKKIKKIISLDILNMRYFLPDFMSLALINFIKKCFYRNKNSGYIDIDKRYGTKDYFLTKDFESGLDILAICRK